MRVFDENKIIELSEYDLEKGYLKKDKLFIAFHPEVTPIPEIGHYEVEKEYPNGGKTMVWVVDLPATKGEASWNEYEDIQVYIPYTAKELAQKRIGFLKNQLSETDYQAIKYAEGIMSSTEYEPIKNQRQSWRDEINYLQTSYGII